MRKPCLGCLLLAACGPGSRHGVDAGGGDDVTPDGALSVDATLPTSIGTVAGESIDPTARYFWQSGGHDQIVFTEGGTACLADEGEHSVKITFPCAPVAAGTFSLVNGTSCATPRATLNVTGFAFPYTELYAQQGSVVITSVAPTIQGSFTATQFYNPTDLVSAPGTLGGTFEVTICP